MQRVVIVGGGSGGTMLANALDPRRFQVTLLSASEQHFFQPALLYVAFAGAPAEPLIRPQRRLLRRGVDFIVDRVTGVDFAAHRLATAAGRALDYDAIVLATGVVTDRSQIPGLDAVGARVGDYHSTVAEAQKLWAALNAFPGGTLALGQSTPLIKCPPSPVEGILLADRLLRRRGVRDNCRLIFFTPYPRPYPAEPMNAIVEPRLRDRGIEIQTFFDVDKIDPATGVITSIEGEEITADLPILIPPFAGAAIDYAPATVLTPDRLIKTDKQTLRVEGVEDAFAIGDATNLPTSKAGVAAHLEARLVARALDGHPRPFAGRTHCPVDLADGTGTFVIGSYTAPVVHNPPTRVKHWMKMMMARIYWISLRGWLEPIFNWYFARTDPDKAAPHA